MDTSTKERIAELICGDDTDKCPTYRSSSNLTRFFQSIGINVEHDGSTRKWWALEQLNILNGNDLQKVILRLASPREYGGDKDKVKKALKTVNEILEVESLKIRINGIEPELIKFSPDFNYEEDSTEEKQEEELEPLPPPKFEELGLEPGIGAILLNRWNEIQKCVDSGANLAAIILMGSLLEGFILGIMQQFPKHANTTTCTPKDKDGKAKSFAGWTLSEMIDVAHSVGWLQLDVKRFSHALREFRNLIHPYEQLVRKANPDDDTIKISWLVVQAASNDIAEWIKKNGE
jgi:hypothetical protein